MTNWFSFHSDDPDELDASRDIIDHLMGHLVDTARCMSGDQLDLVLEEGLFIQFKTGDGCTWTFSIIPEDGGGVSGQLLGLASEEA